MSRLPKLVSFWALLAFVLLFTLQALPITGIVLMMLGAALLTGLLVHVFLIVLLVEAFTRRVPRVLMIIPIAAYGAYYALYFQQAIQIAQKSAELRASNPGKVLDFDAQSYSLVMARTYTFVSQYEIPVAYEANANFTEGYLSSRLIRRDQCGIVRDSQNRITIMGVHFGSVFQQQVCLLQFPEQPPYKHVTVIRRGDEEIWKRKSEISEQTTEISVDGAVVGTFRTAAVWRLPAFPLGYVGCALISSTPAWKCDADFMRSHTSLDTVPEGLDRARYDSPESVMLGIRKYTASDLAHFRGYEQNDAALARIAGEPQRVEDEVFVLLQAIVDGQNPKLPFNMGYSLAQNPARLAPFAEAMARRFVELDQPDAQAVPNRESQVRALASGVAALPRDVFPKVSDLIFGVIQQDHGWDRYPALYVRAADGGVRTLPFYKRDFMTGTLLPYLRMLPVLAICRIGAADDETIAEMQRRLTSTDAGSEGYRYKSALVVALLKLGQESFLREHTQGMPARSRGWMDAVLANQGATETGPNNCMAQEWPSTNDLGPIMQPGLEWVRGGWRPRSQAAPRS
jgi:hypothetical protein